LAEASKKAEMAYLGRLIADAPFFRGAAPDDLAEMTRHARSMAVARGKAIAPPKGKESEIFLLVTGAAALLNRDAASGRSVLIALMGPGQIIGLVRAAEHAAEAPGANPGEWRALTNVTAVAIPVADFNRIVRRSTELSAAFLSTLASHVREVTTRFSAALTHPLEIRLASFLEELGTIVSGNNWEPVVNIGRVQQTQIAELLGVSREHINRTLTMWERSGLVFQSKSGDLIIENRKRLAELAGARRPHLAASAENERIWEIETHINLGLNAAAFDLAVEGVRRSPKDDRFKYFAALAKARMGSLVDALILAESYKLSTEAKNQDVASIIPRLRRDIAYSSPASDRTMLKAAAAEFEKVYTALKTTYPGVNAASTWAMAGDVARARKLASDVEKIASQTLADLDDDEPSYWQRATLAECRLVSGDRSSAETEFAAAAAAIDAAPGKIATTRKQLARLKSAVGIDDAWIDRVLPQGSVLFYCGPLSSANDDNEAALARLKNEVTGFLKTHRISAAIGGLAAGADIVIAECLIAAGVPVYTCLPLPPGQFLQASVAPAGADWERRFIACLENSHFVSSMRMVSPSRAAYRLGARVAMGHAMRLADDLASTPFGLFSLQNGRSGENSVSIENSEIWRSLGFAAKIIEDNWPQSPAFKLNGKNREFLSALVVPESNELETAKILSPLRPNTVHINNLTLFTFNSIPSAVEAAMLVDVAPKSKEIRRWLDVGSEENLAQSLITAVCRPQSPPGACYASDSFVFAATATPGLKLSFDYIGFAQTEEKVAPCPLYLARF